jgi:hypothetical protein
MKLTFSWEESTDGLFPTCSQDVINEDGVSPLSCLLTDDGGRNFLDTVSWLTEGMRRVSLVKNANVDFSDWSRDAWGVQLTGEQARVYSLYDDECFEVISLDSFELVLLAWRDFIQLKPDIGMYQCLDIH